MIGFNVLVETSMICQEFDDVLLNAVDFAFRTLGKSCQQALYFHLKTTFYIERLEIPDKVEEFDNALRLIFSDGAVFLERLILQKLCEELGVGVEKKQVFDFVEAVSKIRGMVVEKKSLLTISDFGEEVTVAERKSGDGMSESESHYTCVGDNTGIRKILYDSGEGRLHGGNCGEWRTSNRGL